jgi:hypothetical protein
LVRGVGVAVAVTDADPVGVTRRATPVSIRAAVGQGVGEGGGVGGLQAASATNSPAKKREGLNKMRNMRPV